MFTHEIVRSVNMSYSRGPMHLWPNGQGYDVSMPIIDVKRDYLAFEMRNHRPVYMPERSKLIVRGKSWIQTYYHTPEGAPNYIDANYETRWCTIPALDIANMLRIADRDGTIRDTRIVSATAGIKIKFHQQSKNGETRYMGNEAALLLQLDGSDEAIKLAEKYSFNHQIQRVINIVGNNGQTREREVTYVNALIVTKTAADAALGVNTYPNEERVSFIPPMTDVENPHWEHAIEQARVVGRLPERQKREMNP
jgi:hypothetical protein